MTRQTARSRPSSARHSGGPDRGRPPCRRCHGPPNLRLRSGHPEPGRGMKADPTYAYGRRERGPTRADVARRSHRDDRRRQLLGNGLQDAFVMRAARESIVPSRSLLRDREPGRTTSKTVRLAVKRPISRSDLENFIGCLLLRKSMETHSPAPYKSVPPHRSRPRAVNHAP